MDATERAKALVESAAFVEAARHCDTFAMEPLIAAAIREAVAEERGRGARRSQNAPVV